MTIDSRDAAAPAPMAGGATERAITSAEATPAPMASPPGSSDDARLHRRRALARAIVGILARTIPANAGLTVVMDDDRDGSVAGDATADASAAAAADMVAGSGARVRVRGPDAVARLLRRPTEDGFAEGYLRGDLDIDGDVATAVEAAERMNVRRLRPSDVRRLVRYGWELQQGVVDAPQPRRSIRLSGRRHSRARDLEAVRFHYDVGESFFGLWLDQRLTYSCGYYERDDDPAADLDAAQEAKLDLICRKLALQPGQRLLDIGCGWGSLILFAAERHGVEAVGITLSERQASEANRRAIQQGLDGQARAEVRDYRDLEALGEFDAVASVGMFEHVGAVNLRSYFEAARASLRPGGRFLNHGIATNERHRRRSDTRWSSDFVERYVFPDGELVTIEEAIKAARDGASLELLDVGLLRPHYALTLRAWVERLERSWATAVAVAGEEVARTWRLYMTGARMGFEHGDLDVAQLLLARPLESGSGLRPTQRPLRPWWT